MRGTPEQVAVHGVCKVEGFPRSPDDLARWDVGESWWTGVQSLALHDQAPPEGGHTRGKAFALWISNGDQSREYPAGVVPCGDWDAPGDSLGGQGGTLRGSCHWGLFVTSWECLSPMCSHCRQAPIHLQLL